MSTAHGWMRTRLAEAQVALMLLTRLPAGDVGEGAPGLGAAAWAFPLAGLAVGGIVGWLFVGALHWGLRPTVAAGVAIVAGLIETGGLHEDGLADVADGFGGGQNRPAKLEIMKDSRLGSYGALALIAALGLRWAMLTQVGQVQVIIALAVASRAAMVPALAAMPAARADGLGRAAMGVGGWRVLVALGLGVVALALALPPLLAVAVAAAMVIAVSALALLAMRQIGGQTGDVLGAMQVLAEIAGWLMLARMS